MSTETTFYRVRRTVLREDDTKHYEWTNNNGPGVYWLPIPGDMYKLDDAEYIAKYHGGTVIAVRHKLIPAKPRTHDRAWALRQLAKGRRVRHTSWNSPMYLATCEERGISLCNCRSESRVVAGVALSPADGYTLWQEPAK